MFEISKVDCIPILNIIVSDNLEIKSESCWEL